MEEAEKLAFSPPSQILALPTDLPLKEAICRNWHHTYRVYFLSKAEVPGSQGQEGKSSGLLHKAAAAQSTGVPAEQEELFLRTIPLCGWRVSLAFQSLWLKLWVCL